MHAKTPERNRLAKLLPRPFLEQLQLAGLPRKKYTAILKATLHDGTVIEEMIVEGGWIIALDRSGLAGNVDRPISLNPRDIASVELLQHL